MAQVYQLQKDAAEKLGIKPSSLRAWMKEPGFPDTTHGYDVVAIQRWRDAHGKKGSEDGDKMQELKLAREAMRLRLDRVKADEAEREAEVQKGNILPRDEFTLTLRELITQCRTRLTTDLPRELAKRFPKLRAKVLTVAEDTVRKILADFARDLEQLELDLPT